MSTAGVVLGCSAESALQPSEARLGLEFQDGLSNPINRPGSKREGTIGLDSEVGMYYMEARKLVIE